MLHQVEKKKDEENKPTSTNNFNRVFNTGMPISSNTIAQYLMKKEVSVVKTANHESLSTVNTKLSWKTKIINEIGPNVEVLRNSGETDEQVYQRHRGIIQGLLQIPVNRRDEMAQRMTAYPHYYLREIITDTEFAGVIDNAIKFEHFIKIFPVHADRVAELVLSEPHFSRVSQVIHSLCFLESFKNRFPIYANHIAELALTDKNFIHLVRFSDDFEKFTRLFPAHIDRIAELILTDDHFARLIGLDKYPIYSIERFAKNFSAHYTDRAIKLALTDKFSHQFPNESKLRELISLDHSQQGNFLRKRNFLRNFHQFYQLNLAEEIAEQLVNCSKKTNYNFDLYTVLVARAAEEKVINKKEAQSQETVLYSVIKTGQFEKAKILLVEGQADANIQTADGDTALKLAKRLAVCKAFIPSDNLEEILDLLIRGRHLVMSFTK